MNDTRNGVIYGALFFLFIIILIVGGYFLTVKVTMDENNKDIIINKEENKPKSVNNNLKINKELDYIYFENIDSKSLEHEIIYQDIKINIKGQEVQNLEDSLNKDMFKLKESFKKISNQSLDETEKEKILYKEDDIYNASFRKYTRYFSKNYASLLIEEYDYDCFNGSTFKKMNSYVFDINTGKILTKNEILKIYDYNLDKIKIKLKEKLEKQQTVVDEVALIDINKTLSSLNNEEEYILYINKSGFLTISYIVKTTQVDYNDVIILN